MISAILYRRTLKKPLPHFIQTKDLAMSADIIMAGAFRSASSNDLISTIQRHSTWPGILILKILFPPIPSNPVSPLCLRNTLAVLSLFFFTCRQVLCLTTDYHSALPPLSLGDSNGMGFARPLSTKLTTASIAKVLSSRGYISFLNPQGQNTEKCNKEVS